MLRKGVGEHDADASAPEPEQVVFSFDDILAALRLLRVQFGAAADQEDPVIQGKMTKDALLQITDYDYIFMQILGFQALQEHGEEIQTMNNHKSYMENPATLEVQNKCGFTMHGDRPGANGIVAAAPDAMLRAFATARGDESATDEDFFREAFDRRADPCLEGRMGRLLAYIEKHGKSKGDLASGDGPPWDDVSVDTVPAGSCPEVIVGEYLRVFTNMCIWEWAKSSQLTYANAKHLWESHCMGRPEPGAKVPNVGQFLNAKRFKVFLGETGVISDEAPKDGGPPPKIRLSREEANQAVQFFVTMETLSAG